MVLRDISSAERGLGAGEGHTRKTLGKSPGSVVCTFECSVL